MLITVSLIGAFLVALIAVVIYAETVVFPERERVFHELWDDASVVRICRDGTRVYRLRNGSFRIRPYLDNDNGIIVEHPETVCN